jgi:hypothetical protein
MTDKEYQIERDKLKGAAEIYANNIAGPEPEGGKLRIKWSKIWNGAFSRRMDLSWRERALVIDVEKAQKDLENIERDHERAMKSLEDKTIELFRVRVTLHMQV